MKAKSALKLPSLLFGKTMGIQPEWCKVRLFGMLDNKLDCPGRVVEAVVGVDIDQGVVMQGAKGLQQLGEITHFHNFATNFSPKFNNATLGDNIFGSELRVLWLKFRHLRGELKAGSRNSIRCMQGRLHVSTDGWSRNRTMGNGLPAMICANI
jgi:hypothetical protein